MAQSLFPLPVRSLNLEGKIRKVGFEFEYAGLGLMRSTEIVRSIFGGELARVSRFHLKVKSARFGDFSVESDASILKERKYEKYLSFFGLSPEESELGLKLEDFIESVTADLVPFEIVTPPIPMDDLHCIESLRARLQEAGAKGTHAHLFAAYGMQFNPEMPAFDVATLLSYMRAFLLLSDRLRASIDLPIARRVLPYIDPFPEDYLDQVLDLSYTPTLETFMRDYLEHNPTRNRTLDWLPLFTYLNRDLVFEYEVEKKLIKPRPTLHYRLPSSLIDDPSWSIAGEWSKWLEVENLAGNEELLNEMIDEWRACHGPTQLFSDLRWLNRTDELLRK